MREDYFHIVKTAFNSFSEFLIDEVTAEDTKIRVDFKYREAPLTLHIFEPGNIYLRDIVVCIADCVADELKLPPHYMRYNDADKLSTLCLLDKEQHILSSYSLGELIELYLNQVYSLLSLSPRRISYEYLKEFEFYWNAACKLLGKTRIEADLYLPAIETASLLNCWYSESNKYGKYVLLPEGVELNSHNVPKGTISTAVYIPIEVPLGIIPPQADIPWDAHDILNIVYGQSVDRISPASYDFLRKLEVDNYQKVVVFSFALPNSVTISFAGVLAFTSNDKKGFIRKIQEDFKSFVPIRSSRMDIKYLHERVGQSNEERPSVLLVGCGSAGSYLLPELVNMGILHIGISDPDTFASGNALRHYLGPRNDGYNKAKCMKFMLEYDNPLVSIDIEPNLLEQSDDALVEIIEKYQIVIIAVGGTDIQRRFNYRFSKIRSTTWFLYNWLDAEGKGSHALALRYSQKGCFECLFHGNGEFLAKNKVTYADGSERVLGNGCGGSFSPYGNNVLIRNTSLVTSVLQGMVNGSVSNNIVASVRNDFSSLESSITITPVIDENFSEEGCDICGHI